MGKKKLKKKENKPDYGYLGGIIVFLISLFTYLKTLAPSVELHDSGELITCAYLLGIPHPPGYPFYCLFGKLWITLLPIGNIAYRMNLASALCASLACMVVYFIVLKVGAGGSTSDRLVPVRVGIVNQISGQPQGLSLHRLVPAAVAALMLAFATTFWEQAVIAEKYTLNALFATLLIFILLKWAEVMNKEALTKREKPETQNPKPEHLLYLFAFTLGLSFTHHFQTIFLVPASLFFIISIFWERRKKERQLVKVFDFWFFVFGLIPLSLYLYLPLRAISYPEINMGDPQTWERLLEHLKAEQFGGYFDSSIFDFFHRLYTYLTQFFTHQFTIYLIWLGLIGAFSLFKKQLKLFIFLALILTANIVHSLFYNIPNIQDHYLPAFIILAIWIGYGIQALIYYSRQWRGWEKYLLLSTCYPLVFLLVPIIPLLVHYQHSDRSQYYFASDLVRNILTPMEEKSIIFLETDDTAFPIWYFHFVEHKNQEAILIDVPFLAVHYDWYARILKKKYPHLSFSFKFHDMLGVKTKELEKIRKERIDNIISNNINSHSIYKLYDSSLRNQYSLIPQGIFCQVLERDINKERFERELDKNKRFLFRAVLNEKIVKDERTQNLISRYPQTYYNIGSFYFEIKRYKKAMENFKQALKIDPKYLSAKYGLGMAYKYTGMSSQALNEFKEILKLDPNFGKAYYGIGYVYQEEGMTLKAINAYKKALEMAPELNFVRVNLGLAYLNQEMIEEAISEFKKVIELEPQNVMAYFNLGIAYTKNKEYQKAITAYQNVLQLAPNHQGAVANLYSLTHYRQ